MQINDFISFKFNPIYFIHSILNTLFEKQKTMKILFKIFILILSILLIQNKAFSYSKNSGKVSFTISVSKADKSDDTSAGVKTEALASKSIENITKSSKDNAPTSKIADLL